MSAIYQLSRRNGQVVVLLTLAFSLVANFGGVGLLAAFAVLCFLTSAGRSVVQPIYAFDRDFRMSDEGKTFILFVLYAAVSLFLTLFHRDDMGVLEPAIKQLVVAYVIFSHFNRHDTAIVFLGAALGAVLAGFAATYEYYYLGMDRAAGATNAIRFGFVAALFGGLSLVGLLFDCRSRGFAVVTAAGAIAGMLAACLSGSIGTALAVPPMLAVILVRLWNQSRVRAASVALIVLALLGGILAFDLGPMRSNITRTVNILRLPDGAGRMEGDNSVRLRLKLLQISGQLFQQDPWLGAGNSGWELAVGESANSADFADTELGTLNQAHNQFANDLAKGGIVRCLAGLAMLLLPLFLFMRHRPFSNDPRSVPALAGVVTCVGFAMIGLSESVLVLNLPASIYAVLVCFLIASLQSAQARSKATR